MTIIDWCSVTFLYDPETLQAFLNELGRVLNLQLVQRERRSRPGFKDGVVIEALIEYRLAPIAVLAWGGESQKGRALLELSGACCGGVRDWQAMRDFVEGLPESRLTRVDVALDLHDGQSTVDDCESWYRAGDFTLNGRAPSSSVAGDWVGLQEGRTFYVGKAKNGKALRCYEKGKQLGDRDSVWTRFEVQFGNRDRIIPFDILTASDRYFTGAYPALERLLSDAGERIETIRAGSEVSIQHLLTHLKRGYGKVVDLMVRDGGIDPAELVEALRIQVQPRRVKIPGGFPGALLLAKQAAFQKLKSRGVFS